ncbi:MAG: UDP-diphosphatase, partial [Flavobacteriaceae bacterium]|nr:UDP-diphosphatase [Flavobacteriaceae bacterium]
LSGLLACTWMIKIVRKSKLTYFAIYCILVGALAIGYGVWG